MDRRWLAFGVAILLTLGSEVLVQAQNILATIQGTITDTSAAPIPGATVVVRNVATGDTRELTTDERRPLPRAVAAARRVRRSGLRSRASRPSSDAVLG